MKTINTDDCICRLQLCTVFAHLSSVGHVQMSAKQMKSSARSDLRLTTTTVQGMYI